MKILGNGDVLSLDDARQKIAQTGADGASITRLALQSGFSDPAYFARLFRRRFGVTPSQCRDAAKTRDMGDPLR